MCNWAPLTLQRQLRPFLKTISQLNFHSVKFESCPSPFYFEEVIFPLIFLHKDIVKRCASMSNLDKKNNTYYICNCSLISENINTCFLLGTVRIPALLLNLRLSPRAMLLTSISNKLKIAAWMFSFPVVWSKTKNFNEEIFIFSKMWSIIKKCLRKAVSRSMSRILKKWFKLMKVYIF